MGKPLNVVEMTIPAKPEFVGVVRLTVSGIANRLGFNFEEIEDIKVAISEAITNTVQHAYKEDRDGDVKIGFSLYEDRLETVVVDCGEQDLNLKEKLPLKEKRQQCKSVKELKEGGFGLYLIDALMDKVEIVSDSGVMVIMTKLLKKNEVVRNDDQISTKPYEG